MDTIDNNRWTEISQQKKTLGYRDVRSSLEYLLFTKQMPHVALLISDKVELSDVFRNSVNGVSDKVVFNEFKTNLSNTRNVVNKLNMLARTNCNLVVIVCADDVFAIENDDVLSALAGFALPTAIVTDRYSQLRYLPTVVDMLVSTPDDLIRFMVAMVQRVGSVMQMNNSAESSDVENQEIPPMAESDSVNVEPEPQTVVVNPNDGYVPLCKDDIDQLAQQLQSIEQQSKAHADRMDALLHAMNRNRKISIAILIVSIVVLLLASFIAVSPYLF